MGNMPMRRARISRPGAVTILALVLSFVALVYQLSDAPSHWSLGWLGGGGETKHSNSCPVYVLDVSRDVAPHVGVPPCDMRNPEVWSHDQEGKGVMSMPRTPHYAYQHSAPWWISKYIKDYGNNVADIEAAQMVYIDTYCYDMWNQANFYAEYNPIPNYIRKITEYIEELPRFKKNEGRDFVLSASHPAASSLFSHFACYKGLKTYQLVTETGMVCFKDRTKVQRGDAQTIPYAGTADVNMTQPVVGSARPNLVYFRAACTDSHKRSAGILLRHTLIQALNKEPADDIKAHCSCSICSNKASHAEVMEEMRGTVFCPVLNGDTAASLRLTEVILSGCIPVFVGAPWHAMPLANDVDYKGFAVFINVTDTSKWVVNKQWGNTWEAVSYTGKELVFDDVVVRVESIYDVLGVLRSLTPEQIERKQQVLERERLKFLYQSLPNMQQSQLSKIILKNMCSVRI